MRRLPNGKLNKIIDFYPLNLFSRYFSMLCALKLVVSWHFTSIFGGKSVAIVITGIPSHHTFLLSALIKIIDFYPLKFCSRFVMRANRSI